MITQIEMQYMEAVKKIAREMSKPKEIDWEQRRYEIAKDVLVSAINCSVLTDSKAFIELVSERSVMCADILIEELQKPKCQ